MLAAVGRLQAGLPDPDDRNFWSMSAEELGTLFDRMAAFKAAFAAYELSAVADADGRGIGVTGATDTAGWFRRRNRMHPRTTGRLVRLARAVRSDRAATGAALAGAAVNVEQAEVIVEVMAVLPKVEAEVAAAAEQFLIGQAAVLDPIELRKVGRELCESLTVDPDPEQQARRCRERRYLHLIRDYDGMTILRGLLDPEAAAVLTAALDPLSAPLAAVEGVPDPRSPGQRRADGLADLAQIGLASGDIPASGGAKPTVVVTVGLDVLTGRLAGAGLLPGGEAVSAATARRIACDAKIVPVVLGGASQPLDIGRAARTVPEWMRRALVVRDTACAFPACDRLPSWGEGHHIVHWADGGSTAIDNLVLLCSEHHQAVHECGWHVGLDHEGLPCFRPPAWIDPDRRPRQHHRYRLRHAAAGPDPP